MSDSNRDRRQPCDRCSLFHPSVSRATDYLCERCHLRRQRDQLQQEVAALREQLAIAEDRANVENAARAHACRERQQAQLALDAARTLIDQLRAIQSGITSAD